MSTDLLSFENPSVLLICLTAINSVIKSTLKLTWIVIYYCKRLPYFSIEPYSKTGYWLDVWLSWFRFHGIPLAARSQSEIYKIKKYCSQQDSNLWPLNREATAVIIRPRDLIHYRQVQTLTRFLLCHLYLHHNTRQSFCRVFSIVVISKIEKVPRGIRGEKSSKDMASSRNLVSTIGALASPKMGDGTRCPEG